MKRRFGVLVLSLFFLVLLSIPLLAETALYVHNKPYPKPILIYKDTVYAVVSDIFPALRLRLESQGRMFCGASYRYTGTLCPSESPKAVLYINGKPIMKGVLIQHGKTWVALPALAQATGYTYQYNPETEIADISDRSMSTLINTPSEEDKSGESTTKDSKDNNKDSKKSDTPPEKKEVPLKVDGPHQTVQTNTNEIWVSFTVTNISKKDVKGVTAVLRYLDGYGKPMTQKSYTVGTLTAGQVVKEEDYWINSSGVYGVTTDVQLDWEGKKKE